MRNDGGKNYLKKLKHIQGQQSQCLDFEAVEGRAAKSERPVALTKHLAMGCMWAVLVSYSPKEFIECFVNLSE